MSSPDYRAPGRYDISALPPCARSHRAELPIRNYLELRECNARPGLHAVPRGALPPQRRIPDNVLAFLRRGGRPAANLAATVQLRSQLAQGQPRIASGHGRGHGFVRGYGHGHNPVPTHNYGAAHNQNQNHNHGLGHDSGHGSIHCSNSRQQFIACSQAANRNPLSGFTSSISPRKSPPSLTHTRHSSHHRHHGHCCQAKDKHSSCDNCDSKAKKDEAKKEASFERKYVALRGKAYKIRKSFLADMDRFESDLVKFVDKKSEEELPGRVIQLLIDFINKETSDSKAIVDLVDLNILASNLGYNSAVQGSLQSLKDIDIGNGVGRHNLTRICATVTLSDKVDDGLKSWLKRFIWRHDAHFPLKCLQPFEDMLETHSDVNKMEVTLGLRDIEDHLGRTIL